MNPGFPLVLSLLLASASAEAQTPRAVFLLDRSGSMTLGGALTRCESSAIACKGDLDAFFAAFPNGEVSVREFNSAFPSGSRAMPGFPEWQSVATSGSLADVLVDTHESVDTAVACSGSTPLADAICDSASALLIRGIISPSAECFFYVYSDGGENFSMGACSGGNATNSATGRCSFDLFTPGEPYEDDGMGGASWQQNACAQIQALSLSCGLVFNVYKFDAFGITTDPALQFLTSASQGTGGFAIEVPDGVLPAPGGFQAFPDGCADDNGFRPLLRPSGFPQLGGDVGLEFQSGNYLPFVLVGFDSIRPGIDLGFAGAPGCAISVDSAATVTSGQFSLFIPQQGSLIGIRLETQGAALGIRPGQARILTSNRVRLTIVR